MQRLFLSTFLLFLFTSIPLSAQSLRINEVVASNTEFTDEDGDSPDWLELRNTSPSAISLNGWQLTDDLTAAAYWTFPNVVIGPDGHLRIWASGKDRYRQSVPRTFITQGDQFRYLVPSQPVSSAWTNPGFNDSNWLLGNSGFGYNDGDDATEVPGGTSSVFVRKRFTVMDVSAVESLLLDMDYDDAFVAYLNGVEIARANINGINPPYDAVSLTDREAEIYTNGLPERFVFDDPQEFLRNGENVLCVQVHNISSNSSDMSLIPFLSAVYDGPTTDGGEPDVLIPIPVSALHTNFKIAAGGETLYLLDADGALVDSLETGVLPTDVSLGIPYEEEDQYAYFGTPTPGEPNLGPTYAGIISETVIFSHPGGETGVIDLSLSGAGGPAVIRYTLDASVPTLSDPVYAGPISITENTVVRARIFREDYLSSATESRTYLVGRSHELPIISLVTDPGNLFAVDTGIYVLGDDYSPDFPFFGANFWQDWERPAHFSLYERNGDPGVAFNGGVKIFGGWSRGQEQRSFSVFARKRYGADEIAYPLFPTRPYDSYQAFTLRNAGNDLLNSNMRDLTLTSLMEGAGLEVQANRPAVTYINGEYWGFYNIREKVNEHFLAAKFDLDPDQLNIAELNGQAIHGDNRSYLDLMEFVRNNSLVSPANYDQVAEQIDIENFIIYYVAQIYFNNTDWPGNNIKFWQPAGGKWRWILFDTDFGFGTWGDTDYFNNTLEFALADNGPNWPNPPWSTLLFRKLIENTSFRHAFINRYADEMNSRFIPVRVREHIDSLAQRIAPEVAFHYGRWGGSVDFWENRVSNMKIFGNFRPLQAKRHIRNTFGLAAFHRLTVQITDTAEGLVRINNRLSITEENWAGDYFEGVPFAVEAVARPGYVFSHWETSQGALTDPAISVNITGPTSLTPVFSLDPTAELPIVINEINYNPVDTFDAGDWVELYNPNDFPVDLSGWVLKDDDDAHEFVIPAATIMAADSYWILARDSDGFAALHPEVSQVIGDFDFGLSSNGDAARLYTEDLELQDEVNYLPSLPWPAAADGQGPTLELVRPDRDNSLAENWVARTGAFGTPGKRNLTSTSTTVSPLAEFRYSPNPFSDQINLSFRLTGSAAVRVNLYDARGVAVHTMVNGNLSAGPHHFSAFLHHLPKGLYYLEIRTDNAKAVGKRWVKM